MLTDDYEEETGTGFFLKGYGLVTCHHVSKFATRAFYPNGTIHAVKFIESDPATDLAILKTDLMPRYELTPKFTDLPIHAGVFLYGFPNYNPGFEGLLQKGQIIGKRHTFGHGRLIISSRVVEGNSGGPLLDAYGNAVGVAVTGDSSQKTGYSPSDWAAVPIRYLNNFVSVQARLSEMLVISGKAEGLE